jgi:hypothetical protein
VNKILGIGLLLFGAAGYALAGGVRTPEIDASAGVAAVALLTGGLVVLRGRRRSAK